MNVRSLIFCRQTLLAGAGILLLTVSFSAYTSSLENNIGTMLLIRFVVPAGSSLYPLWETNCVDMAQAEMYLRAAQNRWPRNPRVRDNLAKALWFQGQTAQAVAEWETLAKNGDDSPLMWFFLGWGYESLGRPEAAVEAWREAGIKGEYFLSLHGRTRQEEGNSARALRLAEIMAALEPDSPKFLLIAAQENENWDQRERAAGLRNRAASLLPSSDPEHWWAVGEALKVQYKWEDAAAAYAEARRLDPDNREVWKVESYVLMNAGQWQAAAEVISGWAARFPQDKGAYTLGARMLSNQYDNVQARQWLETTIAQRPDFALAYYNLGLVYYASDDRSQAIRLMEQAVRLDSQGCPYAWYSQLGAWYREKGLIAEARAAYESAVACRPDYTQARQALLELSGSR